MYKYAQKVNNSEVWAKAAQDTKWIDCKIKKITARIKKKTDSNLVGISNHFFSGYELACGPATSYKSAHFLSSTLLVYLIL